MKLMAMHPDVQKRVQDELESVAGRSRQPTWGDRDKTPFTEAVILEIQRIADILPTSVPHKTNADLELGGYRIPKGTRIIPFLSGLLNDEKNFPDPLKFNPYRFIVDGKFYANPKMAQFGLGKRRCLGESLARLELYIFFTQILHRFEIGARPGDKLTMDRKGTEPSSYKAVFKAR